MENIYFTSDLHLSHDKVIEYENRPISIEEHDDWIIDRINSKVNKKDRLYILGDVSMCSRAKTDKLLDRINGQKFLIYGNHDKNIKNSDRFVKIDKIHNFNYNIKPYDNLHIVLSHYPIAAWERKHYGSYHLHGHSHGKFNELNGLSFDVGVDCNNYYPLSLYEVMCKFKKIEKTIRDSEKIDSFLDKYNFR